MRHAERVVDVEIGALGQLGGEGFVVALLPGVEAEVLEQHDAALWRARHDGSCLGAHAVACEDDGAAQQLAETRGHGPEAELRPDHALRTPEMRGQYYAGGAGVERVLDGRQRGPDARVVADDAPVQRDVEVDADEHTPSAKLEVADRSLGHVTD